ncbi:MAG: polysaccharide deacetylase family protein [Agriterribacter sp.]
MKSDPSVLLSFDVEEFDLPLEYNQHISVERQLSVGLEGLSNIMPLLQQREISTTLFTTAFFAEHFPVVLQKLSAKHEIASHTYYHTHFKEEDLEASLKKLEEITNKKVYGLRMPRMKPVPGNIVAVAGYKYNSSINPCWIPGRYNNRHISRTIFNDNGIIQVPVSVTPNLRIPLFWLAFKNMSYSMYLRLALQTLKKDGYLCLYFHPWEFAGIDTYDIPSYIKRADPAKLFSKLTRLVNDLSNEAKFITMQEFVSASSNA